MKKIVISVLFLVLIISFLSAPAVTILHPGEIIAYRAGGQLIDYKKLKNNSCGARNILPGGSDNIENSMAGISAAVSQGINIIHLNIQKTRDNEFVIFHDWTLDCATNGKGVTSDKTFQELQELDAEYGYKFDGGKTYPCR